MNSTKPTGSQLEPSVERRSFSTGVARWFRSGLSAATVFAILSGAALTGSAVAAEGLPITIGGNPPGLLLPGGPAVRVEVGFSNPNDDSVSVSGLTMSLSKITAPNATAQHPCATADFALTQFTGGQPFSIPAGPSTLQSLGFAQARWPSLQMVETHTNQDGCENATLTLSYSATGSDGPATTITTTTTVSSSGGGTPATITTTASAPFVPPAPTGVPTITLLPAVQSIATGGTAQLRVTVTNKTKVSLTGVEVKDPLATACARTLGTMAAGSSRTYACSKAKVKLSFDDVATMSGKTPTGTTVTATAHATIEAAPLEPPAHPAITIRMRPVGQTLITHVKQSTGSASSTVLVSYGSAHFQIRLRNDGSDRLHAVTVIDPASPSCARKFASLASGATRSWTCIRRTVTTGFTNAAIAAAVDPKGIEVTAFANTKVTVRVSAATAPLTPPAAGHPGVTVTKNKSGGVTLNIPDVLFAFNQSTLRPGATQVLNEVRGLLTHTYSHGHLTVTGYTDSVGSDAYNLALSERRATAVADWLEQHGIPKTRVTISWLGESHPIASNATAAGRQQNRRVTIAVRGGK
jgi:outer membrane protein OmpA-like peptidoglycan-associated protein